MGWDGDGDGTAAGIILTFRLFRVLTRMISPPACLASNFRFGTLEVFEFDDVCKTRWNLCTFPSVVLRYTEGMRHGLDHTDTNQAIFCLQVPRTRQWLRSFLIDVMMHLRQKVRKIEWGKNQLCAAT